MYWSDWGQTPKIEKSFMDGSNRRTIIDSDLIWPNGLAIDFAKKRLYWTDGGKNRIEHSDLEGRNRVVLIANGKSNNFFRNIQNRSQLIVSLYFFFYRYSFAASIWFSNSSRQDLLD